MSVRRLQTMLDAWPGGFPDVPPDDRPERHNWDSKWHFRRNGKTVRMAVRCWATDETLDVRTWIERLMDEPDGRHYELMMEVTDADED